MSFQYRTNTSFFFSTCTSMNCG